MTSPQEPYSIKRHGTTIDNCDREPVQTPGCIQPHGALLVLRKSDLTILQASENCAQWFGAGPDRLLNHNISELLGVETIALRENLEGDELERNPLYLFSFTPKNTTVSLDVSAHTIGENVILEFEATGRTINGEKAPEPDYYSLVKKTLTRFQHSPTLKDFCQVLAEEIRSITSLDRVMIYKFHADESGEVFAEDRRQDLEAWLGFRYPAHDIPKPAREIFKRIWIRPVPSIKAELAEMVPLANPDNGRPLEMTHCALRGASVMYTEYLENMGVGAALTMSLKRDGELWGLVACHHYSPIHFSYQLRAACEFIAQAASLQLKDAESREHQIYKAHIDTAHYSALARASAEGDLSALVNTRPNILDGIEASGAAVFHRGQWWSTGKTPETKQLDALAGWLQKQPGFAEAGKGKAFATDFLVSQYPEAASYVDVASGLLAVPISAKAKSLILWFRPETIQTFTWGGNPNDLPIVAGPNGPRLSPRKSFEIWRETVRNRSLPWKSAEVEAASRLRLLVMDLVVSRAEILAEVNSELARSNEELNAFAYVASHDLKEPLRGIHKYASQMIEQARVGKIEGQQNMDRLNSVIRLATRMDDLINSLLHYSRLGNSKLEFAPFNLNELVHESQDMLGVMLHEKGVKITIPRLLPTISCDRIRIREVFSNLIANAVKYNDKAEKMVEIGFLTEDEASEAFKQEPPPFPLQAGAIFYVKDNGIGIEKRDFENIFRIFKRLHPKEAFGGGSGAGLAIVKKLIQQHHGHVWVASKKGEGSTLFFTLPNVE